tara:strand:- start:14706 stop:17846 length:3141 start_codon:yes stop_codon:yes gene_type:complete
MADFDIIKIEEEISKFWKEKKVYSKAKTKNKDKEKFYFLDGPPYTSGKVHLGTAWNKSLKDSILRYKRMQGFNVWDRAGYDMHGMPIEQAVEKGLKLKNKDDIEKYGVAKFVKACKKFSLDNLKLMNVDFKRIGVWMDFENPYKSVENSYIEGCWWLVKKAHENKRLYEAEKTMHWCGRCATSLSKHELEYKKVADDSVFVKLELEARIKEYLIVWTTTPWTLPFNLGVMVNPDLTYIKAKVDDEVWIVAKDLSELVIKDICKKSFKVISEFTGDKLEGLKYFQPFEDEISKIKEVKQKSEKANTVVLSKEYVNIESGSGLVHMAPGCGPEDYEVGHRNKILPVNTLKENGEFDEGNGIFTGQKARKDDKKIIEELENRSIIVADKKIYHDYPHCWRCKEPVIFRTTMQWFFKIEDLKEDMRKLNKDIKWVPEFAGSKNFDNWLSNLRDNGITRQRYWGTPLPIWRCKSCKDITVVGSVEELKKLTDEVPEDLHKPWIDKVKVNCKCGEKQEREPDILDVWIDAGSASWNCLDYPKNKDLFKKLFPADFILEGIDQIRGWFNLLLVASMISMKKPSFKAVYMHGFINDSQGRKMSKSLGNYILPEEVISKYGADTMRYYMVGAANPGVDLNYNFSDIKVKHKNLGVLWNLHKFLIELTNELGLKEFDKSYKPKFGVEEKYILSRLNSTVKQITENFDVFKINEVPKLIEDMFLDLSKTYIQLVREKASGDEEEKKVVAYTVYTVLLELNKLLAPICPHLAEKIYQNLKENFNLKEISIHLVDWPKVDTKLIDKKLESEVDIVKDIIQSTLFLRTKINRGVRWPIKELVIVTKDSVVQKAVNKLQNVIQNHLNVKDVLVKEFMHGIKQKVKANYSLLGPAFGDLVPKIIAHLTINSPETIIGHIEKEGEYVIKLEGEKVSLKKEHLLVSKELPDQYEEAQIKAGFVYLDKEVTDKLEEEGYAREIIRRIQTLRKELKLRKSHFVSVFIKTDEVSLPMLEEWADHIKLKVGAKTLKVSVNKPSKEHKKQSKEKIKDKVFDIYLSKVQE